MDQIGSKWIKTDWDCGLTGISILAQSKWCLPAGSRSREAQARRLGKQTGASRAASLDLCLLDLVFPEAALAADLITVSISLDVPTTPTPFWTLQYRNESNDVSLQMCIATPASLMRIDKHFGFKVAGFIPLRIISRRQGPILQCK